MSLCIQSSEYNPETQEMVITFQQRGTYRYFGVEQETFDELQEAESQGAYFNERIRDSYTSERIG